MALLDIFRRSAPARAEPAPLAVRAALQSAGGGVTITSAAELDEYLRKGSGASAVAAQVTPDSAMRVAANYACVRLISGAVANMPLGVKRRVDGETRVDASDHWLWPLLRRRPNSWMTPAAFRRLLTVWALTRGNGRALIVRSRGRVTDLVPLDPDRTAVEQQADLRLKYTYTLKNGRPQTFDQAEVLDVMGMSLDGVTGLSVIRYARETIGAALETEKFGNTLFANGAPTQGALTHPGKLGKEGLDFLQASLDDFRQGGAKEGKELVLEEGMKYERMTMSAEDAQWIEARKFGRGEIAMFYGVPPFMIGDTEKSTSWGSGLAEQGQGFVNYTAQDWMTAWEEAIQRDLVPETEPDLYVRHNTAALVRGTLQQRYAAHATAIQWGIKNPNEARADEDMNPRTDPGGDSYAPPPNTAGAAPEAGAGGKPETET